MERTQVSEVGRPDPESQHWDELSEMWSQSLGPACLKACPAAWQSLGGRGVLLMPQAGQAGS